MGHPQRFRVIDMDAFTNPESLTEQRLRLDRPPAIDLKSNMKVATDQGRTLFGLAREAFQICRAPGRISPAEYFYYRLWEDDLSLAEKKKYIGKQAQETMHRACNDPAWHAVTHDKLLLHSVLEMAGNPTPRITAVVHPTRYLMGRFELGSEPAHLSNRSKLLKFLSVKDNYPIFGKPIDGMYSLGVFRAQVDWQHRAKKVENILVDREPTTTEALADRLLSNPAGYIFQKPLAPHYGFSFVVGRRLCSVRLMILYGSEGPRIESAVMKIPVGTNIADNYWRPGNLVGAIDLATGRITQVVTGVGDRLRVSPSHPDTNVALVGQSVPSWAGVCELGLGASHQFPGVRTQSWDIALADGWPVILEINAGGDLNLHQLAHRRGALTPRFAEHLAANFYGANKRAGASPC